MVRVLSWFVLLGLVLGCDQKTQSIPTYTVIKQDLNIEVPGHGVLEAKESKIISSPGQQPMVVAWLAEEYKQVKKGELIVSFDGEKIALDKRKEQLAMMVLEQEMAQKYGEKTQQDSTLASEKNLVSQEFNFAKSFNIDDLRIYSQLEIIDSMQNTEFLQAKDSFLDWKKSSVNKQNQSAVAVLDIRHQGHKNKLERHQNALVKLEVRAPFDGLLVYQQNWRGEKVSVGQSVFPGATIAKLPNLSQMQAKIYVLDKEAIGLAEGQAVSMLLDAFPDQEFKGEIAKVAAFSRTIERGNPTKYFELIVQFQHEQESIFIPGRKLKAKIHVDNKPQVILVPMQAIDNANGQNFVYLKTASGFTKQNVTTGIKNLHFVEILSGLSAGDEVALSEPRKQS